MEGIFKSIPLLPLGLLLPLPGAGTTHDLQPPGGDKSWSGLCGSLLGFARCHKSGADLDTPLFLGSGGTGQHRTVSILTCWKWIFVVVLLFFLSLEVLTKSPVSRFWWREQWFLERVMHSNTCGGNVLNGEKYGLKKLFKISCITTKHIKPPPSSVSGRVQSRDRNDTSYLNRVNLIKYC